MGDHLRSAPLAGSLSEIVSLNIDDLDVAELQRRLEMAVASVEVCVSHKSCSCDALATCGTYCS
jgi:hypothetical protein